MRVLSSLMLLLVLLLPANAEESSLTKLQPLLPITPSVPQRDLRSEEEDFSSEPRGPVAGFVDGITTSDAIVEIVLGRARVITLKEPLAVEGGVPLVAVGDPSVIEFDVAGPRLIRLVSKRVGVSDFAITTDRGETYSFDVHVVYDIPLLQAYLQQIFPDALIKLRQLREHVVLEGQARSTAEVSRIVQSLQAYLLSLQASVKVTGTQGRGREGLPEEAPTDETPEEPETAPAAPSPVTAPDIKPRTSAEYPAGQIINLMTVPGVQQIMLKVQVAELNRTSLRRIGADIVARGGSSGRTVFASILNPATLDTMNIFPSTDLDLFVNALRQNSVLNVLAEPTLVTMDGQEASFLAGGEFPFPVPQASGANTVITIQFKPFGVQLNFVPYIMDEDTIRLRVAPEVSSLNQASGILVQGTAVPAIDTRAVNTTVELSQGQTLAIGGLLQVTLDANTIRIPGLGDLPYIGPFFSNTSHQRVEKELLVMVTPYLVSPIDSENPVCLPGQEVLDPNDCEFYFLNRIEGRTGRPFRSPTAWDNPCHLVERLHLEHKAICGPVGYSH